MVDKLAEGAAQGCDEACKKNSICGLTPYRHLRVSGLDDSSCGHVINHMHLVRPINTQYYPDF